MMGIGETNRVCNVSIAGEFKYSFGSRHTFPLQDRDERPPQMSRIHTSQPHIEVGPIGNEGIQESLLPTPPSATTVRVRSNVGGVSGLARFDAQPPGEVGDLDGRYGITKMHESVQEVVEAGTIGNDDRRNSRGIDFLIHGGPRIWDGGVEYRPRSRRNNNQTAVSLADSSTPHPRPIRGFDFLTSAVSLLPGGEHDFELGPWP